LAIGNAANVATVRPKHLPRVAIQSAFRRAQGSLTTREGLDVSDAIRWLI
jgi:hypothetical protein